MSNNKNLTPAAKDKKARIIILVVTLCLSVAFILASILIAVLSDDYYYDDYYYNNYNNNNNNSNNNPSVSGSLSTGNNSIYVGSDGVYYRFSPSYSGQYIFYSSSSNSSLDPKAVLYDSNWSQIDSDDDDGEGHNFSLTHNLSSGSTYYLKVTLHSGSTDITVTVNRAYSTNGSLYTGSTSVSIGSSSSEVYYSYTPSEDGEYTFFSVGSLDPKVVLYDSYWTQLDDDDDSAGSNNFKLTAELTHNKTYYLKFTARSSGNITVYTISGTVNGSLSIGSNTVSVDSSSDGVYCSFTPSNGGTYTFYSTGSADTEAVLYNSSLSQITSNDDGGDNYNFSLSYRLSSNTTYYLKVSSNYSGNLTVYVIPTGSSLSIGSNSISMGSSSNGIYCSFRPSSSGQYTFYSAASGSSTDPDAVLYDSSLSQLTSDDNGGDNYNFNLYYNLTANNTYYLKVTSNSSGYLTIYVESGAINGSISAGSNTVTTTSSSSGFYFRFIPSNTARYSFYSAASGSSIDPAAVLYDSSFTQLASNDNCGDSKNFDLSYNLTSDRTYYLKITSNSSGSLPVYVSQATNAGYLSSSGYSTSVGSSDNSSYKYFSFTPSSSGTYIFFSSGSTGIDPAATLYNSSWSPIASDDNGGDSNNHFRLSYSLSSNTTYYLKVTTSNGVGSITITVNRAYNTTSYLSTGSNSVYMSASEVYYSFTPTYSGTYTFTSSKSSSSIDPKVVLYDSNWSQLGSDDNSAGSYNFRLSYSLTANKTYYLKFTLLYSSSGTVTVNVQRS